MLLDSFHYTKALVLRVKVKILLFLQHSLARWPAEVLNELIFLMIVFNIQLNMCTKLNMNLDGSDTMSNPFSLYQNFGDMPRIRDMILQRGTWSNGEKEARGTVLFTSQILEGWPCFCTISLKKINVF